MERPLMTPLMTCQATFFLKDHFVGVGLDQAKLSESLQERPPFWGGVVGEAGQIDLSKVLL